jgi:hypothetical protein
MEVTMPLSDYRALKRKIDKGDIVRQADLDLLRSKAPLRGERGKPKNKRKATMKSSAVGLLRGATAGLSDYPAAAAKAVSPYKATGAKNPGSDAETRHRRTTRKEPKGY